ncbi:hypothetical protein MMC25_008092 [Agyrium rufum]|nr:hypothetical protein [Agyrium rufum]
MTRTDKTSSKLNCPDLERESGSTKDVANLPKKSIILQLPIELLHMIFDHLIFADIDDMLPFRRITRQTIIIVRLVCKAFAAASHNLIYEAFEFRLRSSRALYKFATDCKQRQISHAIRNITFMVRKAYNIKTTELDTFSHLQSVTICFVETRLKGSSRRNYPEQDLRRYVLAAPQTLRRVVWTMPFSTYHSGVPWLGWVAKRFEIELQTGSRPDAYLRTCGHEIRGLIGGVNRAQRQPILVLTFDLGPKVGSQQGPEPVADKAEFPERSTMTYAPNSAIGQRLKDNLVCGWDHGPW